MPLAWFAALTFFAALIPPVRIALKVYVREGPAATADDAARVAAALKRGFYADSIVVPPAETLHLDKPPFQIPTPRRENESDTASLSRAPWPRRGRF